MTLYRLVVPVGLAWLRQTRPPHVAAATVGLFTGIAVGISVADRDYATAAACVFVPLIVVRGAARLRPTVGAALVCVVLLGFSARAAAAVVLSASSLAMNRLGFVTGDDVGYSRLAWAFVRYLRGDPLPNMTPPYWSSDEYLFGTWVYIESAIFWVFGHNIVLGDLANALLSIGLILASADIAHRLFGSRAALVAAVMIAVWPSLIVWSALTLKDTLAVTLIMGVLWSLTRLHMELRVRWLIGAFTLLFLMESVRRYMYASLLLLVPIAVALAPRLHGARFIRWTAPVTVLSLGLAAGSLAEFNFDKNLLATFEGTRRSMASGARTAIVQPTPVPQLLAGSNFIVPEPVTPAATAQIVVIHPERPLPQDAPGIVYVRPKTSPETLPATRASAAARIEVPETARLIVVPAQATMPPREIGVVHVRPGDEIIVVSAATPDDGTRAIRLLTYLPVGYAHAVFAPFPWTISRPLDILTIPEMLVWWTVAIAAVATIWRERSRWRSLAPLVLFVAGTLTLLALAEGNIGTLFRHRAMLIPAVIVLAAPTLARLWPWQSSHVD